MPPVRVLVVDDSVVVRRLVSDVLSSDPGIEVVGTASNGRLALTKLAQVSPDLVTLDIEMPEMDGITALRELRAAGNSVPVIMFSTLTERGASATLDALEAGATDYVTKPANVGSINESLEQVRRALVPKIRALVPRPASPHGRGAHTRGGHGASAATAPIPTPASGTALNGIASNGTASNGSAPMGPRKVVLAQRRARTRSYQALVIGCSTGGPEALAALLAGFAGPLPVPVLVVQHMPPVFTRQFATRLDRNLPMTVVEAGGGERLVPGTVYLAPGDFHLGVRVLGGARSTMLDQAPPENFCRPAVDVLFRSAAKAFGGDVLGVVLTGMGSDGRRGSEDVVAAGGSVIVQDEETSVVWGMPGSVAQAGLAEEVLALPMLAAAITRRLNGAGSR